MDDDLTFVMTGSTAGTAARTAILSSGLLGPVFFSDDKLQVETLERSDREFA